MSTERTTTTLRKLLQRDEILAMPGCYDALTARLVEDAGFTATAISGFAVEVAHLGGPDIGLMTMTEIAEQGRRITGAVQIPVITDVDTGFGGVQNIHRTIRTLEQAGLAGVHIEDQALPKRCPVLPGRQLVSIDEAVGRYGAALDARTDPDFLIIARTDADTISYDEQVTRANAYLKAGVDMVMPMLLELEGGSFLDLPPERQMEIHEQIVRDIDGPVMIVGPAPTGYTTGDLAAIGVRVHSHSGLTLEAATAGIRQALAELRDTGATPQFDRSYPDRLRAGRPLMDLMGLPAYLDLETRFAPARTQP